MTLLATWTEDGMRARLRDDDEGLWASLTLVDDWFEQGSRKPTRAWVVEWLDRGGVQPQMTRTRLVAPAQPAGDEDEMAELSEIAAAVARGASPNEPAAFGHPDLGLGPGAETHRRVELLSLAIQDASGRLQVAAQSAEDWAPYQVVIALTESLSWIRALDDALDHIWRKLPEDARREITVRIDEALERPGWNPSFVAWAKSTRGESGYSDWKIGLIIRHAGIPREELRGMRWLAGKMLHFGPLSAIELKQWRQGEQPRWKWRSSADIFPTTRGERESDDRQAYDHHLAGRDLIGTFNLFDALHSAEYLVWELMGRPEREGE